MLALDGLEYNFVKRWDLKGLQQSHFDMLEVPIHPIRKVPISSQVWASFLTGDWEGSLKYADFTYGYWWKDSLYKMLQFIRGLMPFGVGFMKRLTRVHNFVKKFPEFNEESFVDLTGCSLVNVPYYNFDNSMFKLGARFAGNDVGLFEVVNLGLKHYADLKSLVLDKISRLDPTSLTFAYVPFPDFIQHYCFTRPNKILAHYLNLQMFIYDLKEELNNKFLIVSDHGFNLDTETHSCHGFYSANFPLKVSKITDFYSLFIEEFS